MSGLLVRVSAPHFVAGIVVEDERVVRAAPILRWSIGWHRDALRNYFRKKGWTASVIESKNPIDPQDNLSDNAASQ